MEINGFAAKWHLDERQGRIIIFENRTNNETYDFGNPAEFAAVISLLSTANKARLEDGWIEMITDIDG